MRNLNYKLRAAYWWGKLREALSFFATLAFVVFFWWGLVKAISDNLGTVNPNIAVATIGAFVTVLGYIINRNFERKKMIEQQIREKKIPIYEEFIGFVSQLLAQETVNQDELAKFLTKFNQRAIIWFSDESLATYIEWIRHLRKGATNVDGSSDQAAENLMLFEEVLFQFRRDIGHDNEYLKQGDILAIFSSDSKT